MSDSAHIPALEAFAAAQGEISNPTFNRTVKTDRYKFDYADLASILAYVRPILSRHGLILTQPINVRNGVVSVVTRVRHVSGYVVEECELTGKDPGQPQQLGSLTTYLRRYGLLACLAIAAEDDDDAGAAAEVQTQHAPRQARPEPAKAQPLPPEFLEWLRSNRLTSLQFDVWRKSEGKPGVFDVDPQQLARITGWLDGKTDLMAKIRGGA